MKRTDEFANDMCKKLAALTTTVWSCGRQVGSGREAVDVYGEWQTYLH
jgi:hypothetical protein